MEVESTFKMWYPWPKPVKTNMLEKSILWKGRENKSRVVKKQKQQ